MPNKLLTFQQWSRAGYKIKKGSRAFWEDGIAKFSKEQVERYVKPDFGNKWKGCTPKMSDDYYHEMDEFYGTDYFC